MTGDGLTPLDDILLQAVADTLARISRYTNGVWRDRPWVYVPWRAWVYREAAVFNSAGSGGHGMVEVEQQIGIEACFPFSRYENGPSDIEALGSRFLAEIEFGLLVGGGEFDVNGESEILAQNAHELPGLGDDGTGLARAVLLLRVKYTRGRGQPYTDEATA